MQAIFDWPTWIDCFAESSFSKSPCWTSGASRSAITAVRRSVSWSAAPSTVIAKLAVVECEAASIAVQVTVLVPTAKRAPDAGAQTNDVGWTSSVATALKETTAPLELVAFVVEAAGRVSEGGAASVTALAPAAPSSAIAKSPNPSGARAAPTFPCTCPLLSRDTARARGTGGA